ncbi:MAG: hypothetical protein QF842_01715 [Candidatus Marinimicrobia bacterium]|nr:hypothetical protein [Candidatus Neomarinimicrobiota bacterium]MDP6611556.1 hypothetical protein [Candidatus Neomarinimicrobiota bacterium]
MKSFILVVGMAGSLFAEEASDSFYQAFQYRNIGPTRGGRVTAVEGVVKSPGTFYMGATGGGVWKTTDFGITWENISDQFFETPSIGAISVSQRNPNVIYVGTGSDGIRSNVINGNGVYKSTDGGKSWDHMGLDNAGLIGAVEIHPKNSNWVYAAAIGQPFQPNKERGLFRTENGGKTWKNILFIADTVGVVDIEFAPDNPNVIYAATWRTERKPWTIISGGKNGGIYKSTDGGDTWQKKSRGLPKGLIGKIDLAVSPDDPSRLYALVEAPDGEGGLYRSNNRGNSFQLVSTRSEIINRPFYYINITVNPKNADIIFSSANRFMRSDDGGKSWSRLSTPHGDNHDIWIHPQDTALWVQSNDGGVNVTFNSGKTWTTQTNQSTAELYQVEVDDQYPFWLYAGQQDNSTIALPSLPSYNSAGGGIGFWKAVGGCETGPVVPKPGDPNIVYANCKGRFGVFNRLTGQEKQFYVGAANIYGHNPKDMKFRFQRVAPIHVSPHNPNLVYHTSQYVHQTTNDGETWKIISPDLTAFDPDKQVISGGPITRDITGEENYSTIYSIRESILRRGLIWVGANDGPIHVTKDGGRNWTNVTPLSLPGGGRVDCVEPSPHEKAKAYVAVLRYQLGDWKPYIYRTNDYGLNWTLLTTGNNGLPDNFPTRVVREDPMKEGVLYAGTEYGMFVSLDDGQTWESFQQNLPVTPVTDIKVHRGHLAISTMGRGFWLVDNITALHEKTDMLHVVHLFTIDDTYRYRYRESGNNQVPNYPGSSVIIDYYLNEEPSEDISLIILDQDSNPIYSASSAKPDTSKSVTDMATGFSREISRTTLTKKKRTNRFRWNMRHAGAWDKDPKRAFLNGPLAAPGTYTANLIVDKKLFKQSFEILMDPKVIQSGIRIHDLRAQEKLALAVRKALDESKILAFNVKDAEAGPMLQIKNTLVTAKGPYPQPMLIDQLNYLRSMIDRADQRPGKDAYLRYEELKSQLMVLQQSYVETGNQ